MIGNFVIEITHGKKSYKTINTDNMSSYSISNDGELTVHYQNGSDATYAGKVKMYSIIMDED